MWKTRLDLKLKSRLLGEISTISDIQVIPLMAESEEELKSPLMRMRGEWKAGLKLSIQKKMKIMASDLITSWQIEWVKIKAVTDFIFLDSRITTDIDGSHETKRQLLLGRRAMTNLESILKSSDITLLTKVGGVKAMVFPLVMYRCENWTIKKAEHWRIEVFKLWDWRRLLKVLWTAKRLN